MLAHEDAIKRLLLALVFFLLSAHVEPAANNNNDGRSDKIGFHGFFLMLMNGEWNGRMVAWS